MLKSVAQSQEKEKGAGPVSILNAQQEGYFSYQLQVKNLKGLLDNLSQFQRVVSSQFSKIEHLTHLINKGQAITSHLGDTLEFNMDQVLAKDNLLSLGKTKEYLFFLGKLMNQILFYQDQMQLKAELVACMIQKQQSTFKKKAQRLEIYQKSFNFEVINTLDLKLKSMNLEQTFQKPLPTTQDDSPKNSIEAKIKQKLNSHVQMYDKISQHRCLKDIVRCVKSLQTDTYSLQELYHKELSVGVFQSTSLFHCEKKGVVVVQDKEKIVHAFWKKNLTPAFQEDVHLKDLNCLLEIEARQVMVLGCDSSLFFFTLKEPFQRYDRQIQAASVVGALGLVSFWFKEQEHFFLLMGEMMGIVQMLDLQKFKITESIELSKENTNIKVKKIEKSLRNKEDQFEYICLTDDGLYFLSLSHGDPYSLKLSVLPERYLPSQEITSLIQLDRDKIVVCLSEAENFIQIIDRASQSIPTVIANPSSSLFVRQMLFIDQELPYLLVLGQFNLILVSLHDVKAEVILEREGVFGRMSQVLVDWDQDKEWIELIALEDINQHRTMRLTQLALKERL